MEMTKASTQRGSTNCIRLNHCGNIRTSAHEAEAEEPGREKEKEKRERERERETAHQPMTNKDTGQ